MITRQDRRARAEAAVARLQSELPVPIRRLAEQVPVLFPDASGDEGPEENLLGLFVGYAHGEEMDAVDPTLTRIELYLENLWHSVDEDPEGFVDEVCITYLHELGHYLGWDEDELEARGLE